jgi:hypothetical protein
LGEPVELRVTIRNTGPEPIRFFQVLVEGTEPEIEVQTSEDGITFRKWTLGILGVAERERTFESLAPNEPRTYVFRILYDANRESHLVFEHPGVYWIRVIFPLTEPQPLERMEIRSDTLRIVVLEPQKSDSDIFTRIRDKEFLVFLQTGGGAKETALEAAALVKTNPKSGYDSALRSALKRYYAGYEHKLAENEAALLRSILGIELPPPQPFPDDRRLDQLTTYYFEKQTPLEQIYNEISQQSGVKLHLDPALRARNASTFQVTEPLRDFMRRQAEYKAVWVRAGDGYLLKAVAEERRPEE